MIDFTPKEYKIFDQSVSISKSTPQWVDLGLPSGTLWAAEDATSDPITFADANKLGTIPHYLDWDELLDNVPHLYDKKRKAIVFIARNGNELVLPIQDHFEDFRPCTGYWSVCVGGPEGWYFFQCALENYCEEDSLLRLRLIKH